MIDIMMVTYNRLELTKQTLESLYCTSDLPFNLIVIDNHSEDNTIEWLQKFLKDKEHLLVPNPRNFGIAVARNQGLLYSTADWLSTIDNDVLLPQNWLSSCVNILKANKPFAAIGVNFETTQYPLVTLNGFTFQYKARGNLGTACTVFNCSIHKMFGFYNHKDYSNKFGLEDSDFGVRIQAAGLKLGYLAQPGVHLGSGANDVGEYRAMKTREHDRYLKQFKENCGAYYRREKSLYIPFTEADIPKQ